MSNALVAGGTGEVGDPGGGACGWSGSMSSRPAPGSTQIIASALPQAAPEMGKRRSSSATGCTRRKRPHTGSRRVRGVHTYVANAEGQSSRRGDGISDNGMRVLPRRRPGRGLRPDLQGQSAVPTGFALLVGTETEPAACVADIRELANATEQTVTETRVLRVLIADDSADLRDIMRRMVERLGQVVDEAADGQEAVEAIKAQSYDLLLLDLSMPRMSGIDVARWLNAHPERRGRMTVAIVSASAYDERPVLSELGIRLFLPKPLRRQELTELINGLVEPGR